MKKKKFIYPKDTNLANNSIKKIYQKEKIKKRNYITMINQYNDKEDNFEKKSIK